MVLQFPLHHSLELCACILEPHYLHGPLLSSLGGRNASEDFSEAYALYQTDPAQLKLRVPQKHDFMRDWVFSGRPEAMKERGIFGAG